MLQQKQTKNVSDDEKTPTKTRKNRCEFMSLDLVTVTQKKQQPHKKQKLQRKTRLRILPALRANRAFQGAIEQSPDEGVQSEVGEKQRWWRHSRRHPNVSTLLHRTPTWRHEQRTASRETHSTLTSETDLKKLSTYLNRSQSSSPSL